MTDLRARIEAARKAGYSDADIQARLSDVPEIKKAREAGYSDADIYGRLGLSAEPQVTGEVGFLEGVRKSPAVKKLANIAERIAPSPEEVVAGIGEAATNIPESAIGMGAAGYDIANLAMSPEKWPAAAGAAVEAIKGIPGAVYGAVTSPVETIESAAQYAKKDPLGAMAALSAATGAGALMRPGSALAKISQATNPLALPEMAARGVTGGFERFVSPIVSQAGAERKAAGKLYESVMGQPEDVMAALRAEPRSIIDQVPASQRLAERNLYEPGLGTLEADLATGETEIGRQYLTREQQRLAAIQQQLHAIDQQVLQQGRAMTPEAQAELSAVRNDLLRQESTLRGQLETAAQRTGERIPAVGQRAPGEAVANRAVELRDTFRRQRIEPLYRAAFNSAGNVQIHTRGIIQTAENILGDTLGNIPPGVANRTVRDLQRYATGATLEDLDRLRKSVNKDIAAATVAGKDLRDLHALHDAIDAAVENSRIPTRAKIEYAEALNAYRNEFVPRFKTGASYDLLRTTKKNQSGIIPSKTVSNFLSNEDAASQFAATFGDDAIARNAMEHGVLDMARTDSSVVDNAGRVNLEGVDDFIRKHRRQLDIMGINGEALLAPVRQEAETIRRGMGELDREAVFFRKPNGEALRSGEEFVSAMLKDPAAMQVGLRRLSDAGRSALNRELVLRAINSINGRDAEAALKYLADNKTTLRMALDKPYYDRLINLAENQKALQEVEKRAIKPDVPLAVDLSNVPVDKLTDLSLAAREIDRIEKASNLTGLRPAESIKKIGTAETETARKTVSGFLNAKLTQMEKILDFAGAQINRKTAAVLADALVNNPAKAADLIEQEAARRAKAVMPKPPESRGKTARRTAITGALTVQNAMTPENRNAMAR